MPNRLIHILLLAIFLFSSAMSVADERRYITTEDGLPSNAVRSIVQDADGFVWLGTDAGLCRYDGIKARLMVNTQETDQYVSALCVWGSRLLVGSSNGAYVYDSGLELFYSLNDSIRGLVTAFSVDADDNVWVATMNNGLFCYLSHSEVVKHYEFRETEGVVAAAFVDASNQVWVLTRHSGDNFFRFNHARNEFEAVEIPGGLSEGGMCVAQAQDGDILLGTWSDGLVAVSGNGDVRRLLNPQEDGVGTHIHALRSVGESCVLVGCDE